MTPSLQIGAPDGCPDIIIGIRFGGGNTCPASVGVGPMKEPIRPARGASRTFPGQSARPTHLFQAPAGFRSDFHTGRRAGRSTRGIARGPIPKPLHDGAGKRSDRGEALNFVPLAEFLPAHLPLACFGWLGAFFNARRWPSCKIISRAPHGSVSRSLPMLEVKQKEIPQCRIMIPSSRPIAPSTR